VDVVTGDCRASMLHQVAGNFDHGNKSIAG
jgi:hypothetical protein